MTAFPWRFQLSYISRIPMVFHVYSNACHLVPYTKEFHISLCPFTHCSSAQCLLLCWYSRMCDGRTESLIILLEGSPKNCFYHTFVQSFDLLINEVPNFLSSHNTSYFGTQRLILQLARKLGKALADPFKPYSSIYSVKQPA